MQTSLFPSDLAIANSVVLNTIIALTESFDANNITAGAIDVSIITEQDYYMQLCDTCTYKIIHVYMYM